MKLILITILLAAAISSIVFLTDNGSTKQNHITNNQILQVPNEIQFVGEPIKVGILHSMTGTMAISEKPVVNATLLAIDEINEKGGVLGRKLEPIIVDGRSDWPTFAEQAKNLIAKDNVSAVFGGWTSASRKTMLPYFEEYNNILFYPVQYEGLEESPNIVYTGAAPNQQALPAVDWAFNNLGKKFFLVGSDYVFPRSANEIMKYRIKELGGQIVGEEYRKLGDKNFTGIVQEIKNSHPDVILNTINGDSNIWFFQQLRSEGITSDKIPTMSFSIGESEVKQLGTKDTTGDYAAWNYFQSIDTKENKEFVNAFKEKYGQDSVINDPMEAAYTSVYIFAAAVEKAGTDKPSLVLDAVKGVSLIAPEGVVGVDPQTQHLLKIVRIGKIRDDGQFNIISSSDLPIVPIPYPTYKSVDDWNSFLDDLYIGWGEKWSNS